MSRILVVYGSTYGQTERIARRMAGILKDAGYAVETHRGDELPDTLPLGDYDAFLVAASVLMGHHQNYIRDWVRRYAALLNAAPSAFVSVCGAGHGDHPQAQAYIDTLLHETGWRPAVTQSFTGAIAYTRYGWWYRWYLKRISRRKGLPTDASRDWDFTEWSEVERFAEKLAVMFTPASAKHPVHVS